MPTLKELEGRVQQCNNYEESASTLINGLAEQLDGLTQDPVAIKALAQELRSNAADIGRAICANCTQPAPSGVPRSAVNVDIAPAATSPPPGGSDTPSGNVKPDPETAKSRLPGEHTPAPHQKGRPSK